MMKRLLYVLLTCIMLLSCVSCATGEEIEYGNTLFDRSIVHTINIEIAEEDWADLLSNPTLKTKYHANVEIDGNRVEEVSFATKGNTSLSQVAASDSDRYSFKINFGKYVDNQTYFGLDKLNLTNLMSDATLMKDYLSYRIMAQAGVASPLVSYIWVTINGEDWGLYLAVEEEDDSFLYRNYGENAGELYKPESERLDNMGEDRQGADGQQMNGGRGDFQFPQGGQMAPNWNNNTTNSQNNHLDSSNNTTKEENMPENTPETSTFVPSVPIMDATDNGMKTDAGNRGVGRNGNMGFGGIQSSANGAGLVYTDDAIESYPDIFDNNVTKVTEEDELRVIASLKQLSTGEDLSSCVDVEALARYFAAHNYVVNGDSYTGTLLHNYYLYEQDGLLTMLPWDYNLAFGGFSASSASATVNDPIDSPLSTAAAADIRPMWTQMIQDEDAKEIYHRVLSDLLEGYMESGNMEAEIIEMAQMIRPYAEKDPTAFYTVEEFDQGVSTLLAFCALRTQSIRGQLDGTIPLTTEAQQADSSALINADGVVISNMGAQRMGGQDNRQMPGGTMPGNRMQMQEDQAPEQNP